MRPLKQALMSGVFALGGRRLRTVYMPALDPRVQVTDLPKKVIKPRKKAV